MALTSPSLVTVATDGFELSQEPAVAAFSCVVAPTHITAGPSNDTAGMSLTVINSVESEAQPVLASVNTNLVVPLIRPVTIPLALAEATDGSALSHTPPVAGLSVVMLPMQITSGPLK